MRAQASMTWAFRRGSNSGTVRQVTMAAMRPLRVWSERTRAGEAKHQSMPSGVWPRGTQYGASFAAVRGMSVAQGARLQSTIRVFVEVAGKPDAAEVVIPCDASVAALVKASIIELKLDDVGPQDVTLRLEGSDSTLDGTMDVLDVLTRVAAGKQPRFRAVVGFPGGSSPQLGASARALAVPRHFPHFPSLIDDVVVQAIDAIRAGRVTITDEGHLLLPDNVKWPCAPNNVLYVRHFYKHVYEDILKECRPVAAKISRVYDRHLLTGQPGIGKSLFGWYLIYRLLTEQPHRSIVYAWQSAHLIYVTEPGRGVRVAELARLPMATLPSHASPLPNPVLVCDSLLPPVRQFPTVVLASPSALLNAQRDDLNNFGPPRYFPVPTRAEVLDMHRVAFANRDVEGVSRRIQLWGPIPRFAFERATAEEQAELLQQLERLTAIAIADAARKVIGTATTLNRRDVSHRLFIEHAAGEDDPSLLPSSGQYYLPGKVTAASLALERWSLERAIKDKEWQAGLRIPSTTSAGPLCGDAFQGLAIKGLAMGGAFRCRALSSASDSESLIHLPKQETLYYDSLEELESMGGEREGRLLIPLDKGSEAVDALVWSPALRRHLLVTVALCPSHDLKLSGLLRTAKALGWTPQSGWPVPRGGSHARRDKTIKFYCFVPHDQFDSDWNSRRLVRRADRRHSSQGDAPVQPPQVLGRRRRASKQLATGEPDDEGVHVIQYLLSMQVDTTVKLRAALLAEKTQSVEELIQQLAIDELGPTPTNIVQD